MTETTNTGATSKRQPSERALDESRRLIKALREAGYEPFAYGGRGMYGDLCVAVDKGGSENCFDDTLNLFQLGRDTADVSHLRSPTTDSMGLGVVAYWRNMPWPPDEEDTRDSETDDEEGE